MTTTDVLDEKVIGTILAVLSLYKAAEHINDRLAKGKAKEALKLAGALFLILIMFAGLWVGYRLLPVFLPPVSAEPQPTPAATPSPAPSPTPTPHVSRRQRRPRRQDLPERPDPTPHAEEAEPPSGERTSPQPQQATPSAPLPTCPQTQSGRTFFTPPNGKTMERQP